MHRKNVPRIVETVAEKDVVVAMRCFAVVVVAAAVDAVEPFVAKPCVVCVEPWQQPPCVFDRPAITGAANNAATYLILMVDDPVDSLYSPSEPSFALHDD